MNSEDLQRLNDRQAATIRRLTRVLSASVSVCCADDGKNKDAEMDKLERVLMNEGWITTAIIPTIDAVEATE